jgi:hypothetical protein
MTHMQRATAGETARTSFPPEFWVVGGEYHDTAFSRLAGPAEALGPYPDYDEAYKEWERRSLEMKRHAHVRYTIVGNGTR